MQIAFLELVFLLLHSSEVLGAEPDILANTSYVCDAYKTEGVLNLARVGSGLDSFVGENVLQVMLYDPTCKFNSACFKKYMSSLINAIVVAGGGIMMVIIVICAMLVFSPCMCSRRWRRWAGWKRIKEYSFAHDFNPRLRPALLASVVVVAIATFVSIGLVATQKEDVKSGLNAALCETYKFLNQTLNGGDSTVFQDSQGYTVSARFPGLHNASGIVTELASVVAPTSPLVVKLEDLMAKMGAIERPYRALSDQVVSVNEMMLANKELDYHECLLCRNATADARDPDNPVAPSMGALNNSLSGVMVMLRATLAPFVANSLGPIYDTLTNTAATLDSFVAQLVTTFNGTVLSNLDQINSLFKFFDITVIIAIVLTMFPLTLTVLVVYRGTYRSAREGVYNDPDHPPTSPLVASVSIWVTFGYTVIVFLIAGIILVAANVLASGCLVMEDIGSVAAKMTFRFGSATVSTRVLAIVQQCLRDQTNGDMLSGIIVDGTSTARDKVNALTSLAGEFAVLYAAVQGGKGGKTLVDNKYLVNLGKYLDSVGDLFLVTAESKARLVNNSALSPDTLTTLTQRELYDYVVACGPQCAERTVYQASTPDRVLRLLSDYTKDVNGDISVPGVENARAELHTGGNVAGDNTCPVGDPVVGVSPWKDVVSLKKSVMNADLTCFTPRPVTYSATTYLFSSEIPSRQCSLTEFGTQMRNYKTQFLNDATAVDAAVDTNFNPIFDEIWSVIYDELFAPVQWIGETLNCQFVSMRWNALYRSLCVVFTPTMIRLGQTLFTLGFVGIFFTVVQIIVWRHLKDNFCLWQDAVQASGRPSIRLGRRVSTFTRLRPEALWNSMRASGWFGGARQSVIATEPAEECVIAPAAADEQPNLAEANVAPVEEMQNEPEDTPAVNTKASTN